MTEEKFLENDLLLPYQRRWAGDGSKVKVWEKSRRIGASYAEACVSVLFAASDRASGGMSTYYLSYNKEMTRQFIKDCAVWAKAMNKAAGAIEETLISDEGKDITVFRICFSSGFEILALPSEPRSLRSKQGRVVIDEAAHVEDLRDLLNAAMALIMWGGTVQILSTHYGEDNAFSELIKEIRDGKHDYSLHRTTIVDALDEGLYARICLVGGIKYSKEKQKKWLDDLLAAYGDGAAEELYCIPSKSGVRYISRSLVESCMSEGIPVINYTCDDAFTFESEGSRTRKTDVWIKDFLESIVVDSPDRPSYLGMDFARSGDLSVIALAVEESVRTLRSLVYLELRNVPFAQQLQILCYCIDSLKRFYAAGLDARGNGQMIAEYVAQKYGPSSIFQVMAARSFYMEYFPKYKAALEDNELILPFHSGILDDHRAICLDNGVPVVSARTGTGTNKRHGDSVIAGVMLLYAKLNDGGYHGAFEYESVGMKNSWKGL